jgi:hypothetical protein
MVGIRQNLVVELNKQVEDDDGCYEDGRHHTIEADAIGAHRRDLVAGRKIAERHQRRHENSHRNGKHHHPGEVHDDELRYHRGAQTLARQLIHLLHNVLEQKDTHQHQRREQERYDVSVQDMSPQDEHAIENILRMCAVYKRRSRP